MQPEALGDFTQLVQRHADQWYRVALRIVLDHSSAQDCVQDASIKIWANWSSFRGDAQRSTWAYRFVVNEALSARRRSRLVATTDPAELAAVPDSPYFEADAVLTALYAAVAQLPEQQRLVFQFRRASVRRHSADPGNQPGRTQSQLPPRGSQNQKNHGRIKP
jgi:RNA polymerase sigma factor (sigma-70 family)